MRKIIYILCLIGLLALVIPLIFPLYWMIKGAFENVGSTMRIPPSFILREIILDNFEHLFSLYPIARWILNSLIIATSTTILRVFTSCLAGYAFAKFDFPGKNILFWMLMCTIMFPGHATLIPLYIMVRNFGFYNTYAGLIVPGCCSVGFMFLARQYMSTIPSRLIYAARLDGASELKIFFSVIMPLCKPLIAVLCIFNFIGVWSSFIWPLIMTCTVNMRPLAVGVVQAAVQPGQFDRDIGIAMAGATLVAVPMMIIFCCFQKYFTKGITLGVMKG